MDRARIAVACGVLVLLAGFGVGTERALSADTGRATYACTSAIPPWALVTGTRAPGGGAGTVRAEQPAAGACGPVVRRARLEVAAVMALGAAIALAGASALGRRAPRPTPA